MGLGCPQYPSSASVSPAMSVGCDSKEAGWGFINVQGMRNKQGELEELLKGQGIRVLGLAETWLLPGEGVSIKGYKWIGATREGSIGRGGVGMFISDSFIVKEERIEGLCQGIESVWARISGEGIRETWVGVMYVFPHARGVMLVGKADRLADIVLEKQQEGFEEVVMGDFNAHFDSNHVALD